LAQWRSHWVSSGAIEETRRRVEQWRAAHAKEVPGLVGVWFVQSMDDPDFWFVTLETTSTDALAVGGVPAVQALTATLAEMLGGEVRHVDTEDLSFYEAKSWEDGGEKAFRSSWMSVRPEHADEVAATLDAWQREHIEKTEGFEQTWVVRGINDRSVFSLSAQFPSADVLNRSGVAAFDDALARVQDVTDGDPELYNLRGAVR
jgi:hypothetical protein